MGKRKLLRTMGAMVAGVMLVGTTVFATYHEYYFRLETSASGYSDLYKKDTTRTAGYVSLTKPDPYTKKIHFRFVNDSFANKSAEAKMTKVGTTTLSYSGYGVVKGDYLMLKAWNVTTENSGSQITAEGKFEL